MSWHVYRGWWDWYYGWPVGGAAVRCRFQEEERTTASRYSHTYRTVNPHKMCRCFKVPCPSWFTDFWFLSYIFMVYILYWSTWGIWGSFVLFPCFFLPLSKHNNKLVCVLLSLPHLLHGSETVIVVVFFGHGYRGQSQLHQCLAQQQVNRESAKGHSGQWDT